MTDWAEKFAEADALVDDALGDEVEFAADGVTFLPLKCFVYPEGTEADISYAAIDPMSGKPRMKVATSKIAKPAKGMRFKIPQLADPAATKFAPENWTKIGAGRYWLIDLQRAVT